MVHKSNLSVFKKFPLPYIDTHLPRMNSDIWCRLVNQGTPRDPWTCYPFGSDLYGSMTGTMPSPMALLTNRAQNGKHETTRIFTSPKPLETENASALNCVLHFLRPYQRLDGKFAVDIRSSAAQQRQILKKKTRDCSQYARSQLWPVQSWQSMC